MRPIRSRRPFGEPAYPAGAGALRSRHGASLAPRFRTAIARALGATWLATCAVGPVAAAAQNADTVLTLDPSTRAAGTGGAGNAAFWGGNPNAWSNPALLGYYRGARFESERPVRLAGTASSMTFEATRFSVNLAGLGLMLAGTPDGFGRIELGPDAPPNPGDGGDMRVHSWGVGLSAAELVSAAVVLAGGAPPPWTRRFDIAAGMMRKRLSAPLVPAARAGNESTDRGVLVRWTPVNTFDQGTTTARPRPALWRWPQAHDPRAHDPHERPFPDLRPRPPRARRRLDFAYGYSELAAGDATMSGTTARLIRHGVAARTSSGTPARYAHTPWLQRAFTPLFAMSGVADLTRTEQNGRRLPGRDTRSYGVEITLVNVVSIRSGHTRNEAAGIDDKTTGLGLGLDLGDLAGARWDWARVPQAAGSPRAAHRGFTVWADPVAMIRAMRHRRTAGR